MEEKVFDEEELKKLYNQPCENCDIHSNKVPILYAMMCSEECGDGSVLMGLFKDKQKAEKYIELHDQVDEDMGYNYWINEIYEYLDEEVDLNAVVNNYYEYCAVYESSQEENDSWADDEVVKKIDSKPIIFDETEDYVTVWSRKSFEEARTKALQIWETRKIIKE